MVQTVGTLGRFTECAGSGDGLSRSRGESLASEEAPFGDFQPSRARQIARLDFLGRACHMANAYRDDGNAGATPQIDIQDRRRKTPLFASANFLDTSHICRV